MPIAAMPMKAACLTMLPRLSGDRNPGACAPNQSSTATNMSSVACRSARSERRGHQATASRKAGGQQLCSRSNGGAKAAVISPRLITRIRSHMPISSSSSDEMKSTPPPPAASRSASA